ncbi:YtxH domain-containing protein [Streptococcus porcinus]|uniref:Gas vesicle protein n=1 Tax=Streptococcus porcinus TaxID=1340 RepID=A0A4V0HA78_STRPO|nr:YtxH domain-containing protein [Streptococcus porcinus]VTT44897.1 gas vesicle protein [Streptococcus porcinus]VTT46354.1 gas vesicle protein [Streptococcus porcinus]
MSKFLKSFVIGTATGIATAYFLSSDKGKAIKARAEKAFEAYKENPDDYHQMAKEKGSEYSNLAKDTFTTYKNKFENGELTPEQVLESVKETTNQFLKKASQYFAEQASESSSKEDVTVSEEDVIIDYTDIENNLSTAEPVKTIPNIEELDKQKVNDLEGSTLRTAASEGPISSESFSEIHKSSEL